MSSNVGEVLAGIEAFGKKAEKDVSDRLELAGAFLEGKMVDKITSGLSPALHPATIEAKGSSTPLIDTGELLDQITHHMDGDLSVGVGVFGSRATIASYHEFGKTIEVTDAMRTHLNTIGIHLRYSTLLIHIPERSFVRSTFNEQKNNVVRIVKGL